MGEVKSRFYTFMLVYFYAFSKLGRFLGEQLTTLHKHINHFNFGNLDLFSLVGMINNSLLKM